MLFDCARCRQLTPQAVRTEPGLWLHQFRWTDAIGDLDPSFNHLCGVDPPRPDAKIAHLTLGLPIWTGYGESEYADEWREELRLMLGGA